MQSRQLVARFDQLLDAPEASRVLLLKATRRCRSLADKGSRWLARTMGGMALPPPPSSADLAEASDRQRRLVQSAADDRFVLIRIIGNDLYPRHDAGQSLQNLQFILEHEPVLPGCEKRWLLNRIRQPERLSELTRLLEAHGYGYDVIPFEPQEFHAVPWDWSILPTPDFLATRAFLRLLNHQRQGWEIALYRGKNNYLMNNNGARNRALEIGRQRADWVLPWDGNCFLTASGWDALRRSIASNPETAYFHVPMQRVEDNAQLLDPGFEADPRDEPQLVFAAAAPERFNDAFPYGRRPKVELFWRLGLGGPWDAWPDEPWDQPRRPRLTPQPACPAAGWVARLHSGVRGASPSGATGQAVLSQQGRYLARNLAIKASINQALQPGEGGFSPAAFGAYWCATPALEARSQAAQARACLQGWWRWWEGGAAMPSASPDQLISAFCRLHGSLGSTGSPTPQDAELLERMAAVWFPEDGRGLQPRLRLLQRPLSAARLPGLAPSAGLALQIALLADLLVCRGDSAPDLAPAWSQRVLAWCDRLREHLQALADPAWLGDRVRNQQRLLLTLAVLQGHCGHPTAAVDALLRLLALHHPDGSCINPAHVDPELQAVALGLAARHGLLDRGLAEALRWTQPGRLCPPLAAL